MYQQPSSSFRPEAERLCCLVGRLPLSKWHFPRSRSDCGHACGAVSAAEPGAPRCCCNGKLETGSEEFSTSADTWGLCTAIPWGLCCTVSPHCWGIPKLTLPWLASSTAATLWASQRVLCPSHYTLFSLFSPCFIVMGFAEGLLTSGLLNDGSVFFSCRLHLCIVLLNCWMNVPGRSVTESFPPYYLVWKDSSSVAVWIRVNIYRVNGTEPHTPLQGSEFVSISTHSELSIKCL